MCGAPSSKLAAGRSENDSMAAAARHGRHFDCIRTRLGGACFIRPSRNPLRSLGAARVQRAVVLASKDGVLEVTLTANQGEARLDTVATPVKNMLVFAYELIRGTASNGQMSGDNLYPAPTLQVFPGRDADRPSRQRAHRPHHPGFLRSAIYGEGRGGAALPADDDLVAAQPARPRRACQPQGQLRQRDAAHPRRDVEHLHLPYPEEHAARRLLVSQPSAWADDAARLLRHGGPARDRPHRRQPSAGHAAPDPDPQHGAAIQ